MTTEKPHDIVLFGATGFTGRLVFGELCARARSELRFAIAGRNAAKLEEVKASVAKSSDVKRDVPVLVGDSNDEASLRAIAKSARVVCTTVGPYQKYGRALARICAEEGAHYTDLTGEVPFMRASIDENDAAAKRTKARIVHACGFDSIPSDLAVYLLHRRANEMDLTLGETTLLVKKASGGFSGGTISTMMEVGDEARRNRDVRALVMDPHALEQAAPPARDRRDKFSVAFDDDLGVWTAPFIMAMANTRVVRRSNALFEYAYGPSFRYREVMCFKKGARGAALAAAVGAATAGFAAALSTPSLRAIVGRRLPKPGEGPSPETQRAGGFVIDVVAKTLDDERNPGPTLVARVEGRGDPGYSATSRMLAEASMCLAEDALPDRFGVLTPAFAMGDSLVARLEGADVHFHVRG
jgi:short subunit dehydrogenase-like uncharacterized protein